jgi:hypothetical protein
MIRNIFQNLFKKRPALCKLPELKNLEDRIRVGEYYKNIPRDGLCLRYVEVTNSEGLDFLIWNEPKNLFDSIWLLGYEIEAFENHLFYDANTEEVFTCYLDQEPGDESHILSLKNKDGILASSLASFFGGLQPV